MDLCCYFRVGKMAVTPGFGQIISPPIVMAAIALPGGGERIG